jgi:CDP-diacylglycerol pyrophosphatase
MIRRLLLIGLVVIAAVLAVPVGHRIALSLDRPHELPLAPYDLWRVIHYACLPSARLGLTFPCSSVHVGPDGTPDWAILPVSDGHILTVPARAISGIESPDVLKPGMPNYWQAAWEARTLLRTDDNRPIERTEVALALNSAYGRSQRQLHIHTACLEKPAREALALEAPRIGESWTPMQARLEGRRYQVRQLAAADLADVDVFSLLPEAIRAKPQLMARQTLVVVGARLADGTPGFYILNDHADASYDGHGESLLNFRCPA